MPKHYVVSEELKKRVETFGSFEECRKLQKNMVENYNMEYWIMDIINPDYGKIINKIKGKRVFFDLSNIFSYHTSHVCYTLTELVESLDRLIETLSNNTEYFFIRGKKPTKQSMPNEKK